jgi:hypothetical protein
MTSTSGVALGETSFFPSSLAGVPRGGVEASPRPTEMTKHILPERSGVPLEAKAMRTTIEEIARDRATLLASVTTGDGRTTTVFLGADGTFRVITRRPGQLTCTIEWCRTRSDLMGSLRRDLGAGDFALLGWRLLGKAL